MKKWFASAARERERLTRRDREMSFPITQLRTMLNPAMNNADEWYAKPAPIALPLKRRLLENQAKKTVKFGAKLHQLY